MRTTKVQKRAHRAKTYNKTVTNTCDHTAPFTMECLNDDTLILILKHLPLHKRLSSELVCHRWLHLMPYNDIHSFALTDLSWPHRHVNEFTYTFNNLTYTQRVMGNKRFVRHLEFLLNRFGLFLRRIKFSASTGFKVLLTTELMLLISDFAPRLQQLSLAGCVVHVQACALFKDLPHLQHLDVASCHFLDSHTNQPPSDYEQLVAALQNLVNNENSTLRKLNVGHYPVLPQIQSRHLQSLNLNNIALLDNLALSQLVKDCDQLEVLSVADCRLLTDLTAIAQLYRLKMLTVNGTKITNENLHQIAHNCLLLEYLRLDNCNQLTSFTCLKSLRRLSVLWVGPANSFGDGELARICRHGRLTNPAVSGCRVSDDGIRFLASHCRNLSVLTACGTQISDEGVAFLLRDCANLRFLNIQSTNITNQALANIGRTDFLQSCFLQNCRQVDEHGFDALFHSRALKLHECARNGVARPPAMLLMAGGESLQPISDTVVQHLANVDVTVQVLRPLLALPFVPH